MSLAAGTRLGPYEVLGFIGAGGMGEVYRARDTRLARDVAVKVLPSSVSGDIDRLRRFDQEARAASALNHPNVLVVHDVGADAGISYIVSEFLDGVPMREVLSRGSLPVRMAVEYALQIARGLTAAHEHGIIHRDLKPENLFITRNAQIKILDFGIAKLNGDDAAGAVPNMTTLAAGTAPGVMIGTVTYMSPEQVKGERVDQRSDIFSFGTVLHEMLSGACPFSRESPYQTLHAILTEDPPDLSAGGRVPTALSRVVRRCLDKDPSQRFQAMRDVAFAIEAVTDAPSAATVHAQGVTPRWRAYFPWLLLAAMVVAAIAASLSLTSRRRDTTTRVMRFEITPPVGGAFIPFGTTAVSAVLAPDGHAAVLVVTSESRTRLYLRSLDSPNLTALPGTEDGSNPFWSPDSRWIAFFQRGTLRKIEPGNLPQTICNVTGATIGSWGAWGADELIVLTSLNGIDRVRATGGQPIRVTTLPKNEYAFWPTFLPDGRHFIYLRLNVPRGQDRTRELRVRSIDPGGDETTLIGAASSRAVYAEPGYLLFVREGTLLAQPFDAERIRLTGQPTSIAEDIVYFEPIGSADFSVSRTGILAYQVAASTSRFVWYTREGTELLAPIAEGLYDGRFRISPDGGLVAVAVVDRRTGNSDVWIADLNRVTQKRFTFDAGYEVAPFWSPDGARLAFSADQGAPPFLHAKRLGEDGSGEALTSPEFPQIGCDWAKTPAGEFVLYSTSPPERGTDLFALPVSGNRAPTPWAASQFNEADARFSPDGRWVAYVSDESARPEVYVRPFPGSGDRQQVSTSGGSDPRWSRDGRELFYVGRDDRLMSVTFSGPEVIGKGVPKALFTIGTHVGGYEVAPDGQRFLVQRAVGPPPRLAVVLNWPTSLQPLR